ncbi:MAG: RagB/SusD family nutrient uptake outer membrane protein [Bacteroidetes bacterium]|nr:RagB/SusD family nutrient uptake outer membrane protein [Bacteroidota bacterium]
MKRTKQIILLSLILAFSSCENFLELIPPDGLVSDEYWKSKEDIKATLMGAYQKFASLDDRLFILGEVRGDMIVQDVRTDLHVRNIMNGNIYPDNTYCNWTGFYAVINFCNYVLKYAPLVREIDPTFTEYQMRGYEAEALFLRSLAYFYLVRSFRNVPLILEPSESDGVDFYQPASTEVTVLGQIKADLQDARLFVTASYPTPEENKGRATKAAINALLADICLWNFEYEECIAYVKAVEEEGFVPVTPAFWYGIFYPGNSLEGIFEFQFDQALDQLNKTYNATYYQDHYKGSEKALELLGKGEVTGQDYEFIRGPGSLNEEVQKIWKYCGSAGDSRSLRPSSERFSCNWIVYRMSDLVLMKAEALSQIGRYDEALALVNDLRQKRQVGIVSTGYNASAFEDLIMEERMIELAYEGKRWFDMLRMGRRNNYQRKTDFINLVIENVPSTQKLVLASKLINPLGWYLPIYFDELERNRNLEQNPYYAEFSTD